MTRPASLLSKSGSLRRGLNVETATDILWLHNDPVRYDRLVHQRRWTPAQFRDWLAHALTTQLLGDVDPDR